MLEAKVERGIKDWAKKRGWDSWKWTSPAKASVPDQIFLRNGVVVFIEMKATGKKPTGPQYRELQKIRDNGGNAHWADSVEVGRMILDFYEVCLRSDNYV